MAYIQNGIHSKWHGIAKQFNTAKVGHESNNKVIQNTGDMFNHTFNGMANWSINKLNNTDFKHLIHKSKHAKLHLSKNTRQGENHDATLKIKKTWSKNTCGIQKQVLQAEKSKIYLKLCFLREFCLSKNVVWFNGSAYRKLIQKETETFEMKPNRQCANTWQNLFQNCEFSTKICNKGLNNN